MHRHIGKEIRAVANLIHRKACKNNDPIPYPTCDDPIFNTQGSNLTGMQKLFFTTYGYTGMRTFSSEIWSRSLVYAVQQRREYFN